MIFAEIDRLVNLGNSIPKAIAIMKRGSYEARMRGVKAETWKRYYVEHLRRRELQRRGRCLEQEAREQVAGMVPGGIARLLAALSGEMSVAEMMVALKLAGRRNFLEKYLSPAIDLGLVEMTQPSSPNPTPRLGAGRETTEVFLFVFGDPSTLR